MTRCALDGLTKDKLDTRNQHENERSGVPSAIFWHAKDFSTAHEVAAEAGQTQPVDEDAWRCRHEWLDVITITPEIEHFHFRVSILCQVRDSVTGAIPKSFDYIKGFCMKVFKTLQDSNLRSQS